MKIYEQLLLNLKVGWRQSLVLSLLLRNKTSVIAAKKSRATEVPEKFQNLNIFYKWYFPYLA